MKSVFKYISVLVLAVVLLSPVYANGKRDTSGTNVLTVGATPVPHGDLLNLVKDDLAAKGIELRVVEFSDYVLPNMALDAGDLDANFFQHVPYLNSFNAQGVNANRSVPLVSAFGVHVEPMGFFSSTVKNISALKNGATIAIPNDPTNEGRALLLLESNGLIKLAPGTGLEGTPLNIIENSKGLRFRELDAAQLPRSLGDVDGAIINGNFALGAGLSPVADALFIEGADSPYVNVIAVKKGNENDPRILALKEVLQSQKVKNFILKNYEGGVVAAF